MTRLNQATEIAELAEQLGLPIIDPATEILDHCRGVVDAWVAEARGVANIDDLESLVTKRLQLVFEEIRCDDDFDRLTNKYAREMKEYVFASMKGRFIDEENPTFGALVQRRHASIESPDRFVAIIDCRGNKLDRRFFTRWHEIAHRLTTHADIGEPVYRSEHDPIERMMDEIASHIGFYEPLFNPVFRKASEGESFLSFDTVATVVTEAFPKASFQATLFACARRTSTPVLYLEAKSAYKQKVKRRLEDKRPKLFEVDDPPPPGELRAVMAIANLAAKEERFTIPRNMRVPKTSVIHAVFAAESFAEARAEENLKDWETSDGKSLEDRAVFVEARKVSDRVFALVQPVEPLLIPPRPTLATGLFNV